MATPDTPPVLPPDTTPAAPPTSEEGATTSPPIDDRSTFLRALDFVFLPIWHLIVTIVQSIWLAIRTVARYIWDIVQTILQAIKALLFLVFNTFTTLLPSAAFTTVNDDSYNKELIKKLEDLIMDLPIDSQSQKIIVSNWLEQLGWTNSRATRERNANELIRWWQIILGVLIPVIANSQSNADGFITPFGIALSKDITVSTLGIFVAILTAVAQFRRPEERWRHYRLTTESYLNEIWAFIALSGKDYNEFSEHTGAAVKRFHERMSQIRQEDTNKFFGEIFNDGSNRMTQEDVRRMLTEVQNTASSRPQASPPMTVGQPQIIPPNDANPQSVG